MHLPSPRFCSSVRIAMRRLISFASLTTIAVLLVLLNAQAQSTATPVQPIPAWQSAAGGRMEFEVASIRPVPAGARPHSNMDLSPDDTTVPNGGRFSTVGAIGMYIQFAYKLSVFQDRDAFNLLPKWAATEFFDIEAKAPMTDVTKDQMRLMMQSLLSDRFKLAVHFETKEVPVMALELFQPRKLGPRLRPHSEGPPCDAEIPPVERNSPKIPDVWVPVCGTTQLIDWANNTVILGSRNTNMDVFANYVYLIQPLDGPVINRTGLTGNFDIELNFTPPWKMPDKQNTDMQLDSSGPSFLEALKYDLGMKLIPAHAGIQMLVIDHIEQPSPN